MGPVEAAAPGDFAEAPLVGLVRMGLVVPGLRPDPLQLVVDGLAAVGFLRYVQLVVKFPSIR